MKIKKDIKDIFLIKNKVCLITGGTGGIGSALADLISHNGGIVCILDKVIKKDHLIKNVHFYKCDLSNKNKVKIAIKKIIQEHKKIDCLVNAVGITNENSFVDNININLIAIYNLTKIIIEKMKKRGGSIVNITSLNSELGFSNNPGYVSSKGGLKMLTKSFCVDYSKYKIRINNIGPGYIKTQMTKKKFQNKKEKKLRIDRIPMKRYGEPHELFGAIIFLLTDASSYVTGQDLYVDGGFLAKGI
tara:strand:- start:3087 stop:3821 length:735 start_codon:yes stop_codon:yes gene_type:complete